MLRSCITGTNLTLSGVSLGDLLEARPTGLTEGETWAILCQAVQALQDLFLSDGAFNGSCIPVVSPSILTLSNKGRVKLCCNSKPISECESPTAHLVDYLAPEYRPNKQCSDTENEKMWIYGLGETLKRATLTSHAATSRLSAQLCQVFNDMTEPQPSARASLMHLLEVISEYCKSRQQTKPFSHIVMDLHQEAMAQLETTLENPLKLRTPSHIRVVTRSDETAYDDSTPQKFACPGSQHKMPKQTKEASTSMEDLSSDSRVFLTPGSVIRPKSICLPALNNEDPFEKICVTGKSGERSNQDKLAFYKSPFRKPSLMRTDLKGASLFATKNKRKRDKMRKNPIHRAASRLYKASEIPYDLSKGTKCIGPEFVVRATLPPQELVLNESKGENLKKTNIIVIMLDGQKLSVACKPNNITAGQLFELILQKQPLEENFMLGLSALIAGDFVFLPSDARIHKVFIDTSNQGCHGLSSNSSPTLTLFLRVRFFLPTLKGISSFPIRHLLYLQLRRSVLEYQLPCSYNQFIDFGGLALQAEFGDYLDKEHGTREYFLLEHYVPESVASNSEESLRLRQELTKAHILQRSLSVEKAEEAFILLAQSLPHYGGHFYTAIWVQKDNNRKNIWLHISAHGINIYERNMDNHQWNLSLLEMFEWKMIQTLCYSKHYLCIIPHFSTKMQRLKLKKYKIKMDYKKSYFTFRLASLHHQFFLRLRMQFDSDVSALSNLSRQFGIQLKDIKNETNAVYKLEAITSEDQQRHNSLDVLGSINAKAEFRIQFCGADLPSSRTCDINSTSSNPIRLIYDGRSKSLSDFGGIFNSDYEGDNNFSKEEWHYNKENENPRHPSFNEKDEVETILDNNYSLCGSIINSGVCDKRRGVKMGVRAFGNVNCNSRSMEAINELINDDFERLSLQSTSLHCSSTSVSRIPNVVDYCEPLDVYVIDSSIKSCSNQFFPDLQETLSETFLEKLDKFSFDEERLLYIVRIERNINNSLGLQVMEGIDGKVYVQSVIPGGPAYIHGNINVGDQVIAVNGHNLLSLKYAEALELLKNSGKVVEFVMSHVINSFKQKNENKLKYINTPSSFINSRVDLLYSGEIKGNTDVYFTTSSSSIDKQLLESHQDNTHSFKLNRSINDVDNDVVPYHKHIRYDLDTDFQGINRMETSQPYTYVNHPNMNDKWITNKAVIVDMIPKVPSVNSVSYSSCYAKKDSFTSCSDTNFINNLRDVQCRDVEILHIPLPRTLGLSRRWRGPVKYPVTPIRKMQECHDSSSAYVSTSDEEQVFI